MMKNLRYIWIAALCLALIGCSRETVNSDVNSTTEAPTDAEVLEEIKQENDLIAESDAENSVPKDEETTGDEKNFRMKEMKKM